MKVLIVGPNSVHTHSFIAALNQHGLTPDLLSEVSTESKGIKTEVVLSFREVKPWNFWTLERKLKTILENLAPEIIHIHQINRVAYFVTKVARKLNIPVLTTAWGSDVLVVPNSNRFYRFLVKKTLERSRIVTGDSHEMVQAMKQLCPEKRYQTIQYGIDPILPSEKENIIYSNRLHKELYRIDQVVKYFADFSRVHSDWKLVIGAVGTETERLKELVKSLDMSDKVEFVGWLEKVDNNNWYSRSKIYISIPKHDGTAVSLLEAMSAACIPVVSDLVVSREWIEDGNNGVIEKDGKNPLLEAVQIDSFESAKINKDLIDRKALREMCTKEFLGFYSEIIG